MQPVLEATTRSLAGSSGRAAAVKSSRVASALQPSWCGPRSPAAVPMCVSWCTVAHLNALCSVRRSSCRRFQNRRQLIRFAGRSGLSAEAMAGDGERRASSLPAASATMNSSWEMSEDVEVRSATQQERVGVLLLNLGGPENLDDVQPFLYNLFADPDIIRLPAPIRFLQPALATLISTLRAPKVRAHRLGAPLCRSAIENFVSPLLRVSRIAHVERLASRRRPSRRARRATQRLEAVRHSGGSQTNRCAAFEPKFTSGPPAVPWGRCRAVPRAPGA